METFRVRRKFNWRGWSYAPAGPACACECPKDTSSCSGKVATNCGCKGTICNCSCGIPRDMYAGDIWFVEDNHPRKETMIDRRFVTYDSGIPPVDELVAKPQFKRLLGRPKEPVSA